MRLISTSRSSSDSGSGVPNRALSPRPRAFLCAMNNLLCEADVCLSTFGFDVVKQYWAAMARCLTEPYISRNDGRKYFVSEEFPQITHHLIGQVCSLIKHRQQNAFNLKGRIP